MAGQRTVILGGGFGGITAALELRRGLDAEHSITLVDRRGEFFMGLRKLWAMTGETTIAEGSRPLDRLATEGVDVRRATVQRIDAAARRIDLDDGSLDFDFLVIALGAESRPDLVPGFSDAVFNLYDPNEIERLAAAVQAFTSGRVHVAILGVPYKCPPAPYEAAMLLNDLFVTRGVRQAVSIAASTPQPMSLPVAGAAACAQVEGLLAERNISFTANRKLVRLEGTTVVSDETSMDADLLIGVPPHRPPALVKEAGLEMRGEWIAVDTATMRTSVEGIYAVGDVTEVPLANGMALPKAGVMAEGQAKVAAAAIIAAITGQPGPQPFDGRGYCWIEAGREQAAIVQGNFLATPGPDVQVVPPSAEGYQQKLDFERSRLNAWFR